MAIQADCLFCGEEPCATHADKPDKKQARKPRTLRPKAQPLLAVTHEETEAPKEFVIPVKADRFSGRAESVSEMSEEDRVFREAIINLWDILSPATKMKYRDIVDTPKNAALSKRQAEVRRMLDAND